ncbi:hypothetical protein ACH5RR_039268 [Cinchona calisaya]|uniref:Uncharacterized protein n=1 Tax=Cinchona calisaya TaxID=153742 RepID=A0ABD2Y1U2_9GENT
MASTGRVSGSPALVYARNLLKKYSNVASVDVDAENRFYLQHGQSDSRPWSLKGSKSRKDGSVRPCLPLCLVISRFAPFR